MPLSSSWTYCNNTLLESDAKIIEDPLWHNGPIFHHFALFLCAVFGGISVVIALFLVFRHATHYLKPTEQRHIIRILLMIPIYSIVSFLSYMFYWRAVYFEVLRDCYEAFAIASFFTLLCYYVAPTLHDQKDYFRTLTPINWFWGVFGLQKCTGGENKGPFRKPRSGLTWFNVVWVGVFQYCFIRILFTIVSVVTQYFGRYCEETLSPLFAHVWVVAFECASVTIAMFCLIQFYLQLRGDLAEHKPFLKVLCIKLVIFFSFWQTEIISLLSSSKGPLQPSKKIAYQDIKVGMPNVLLCIEMAIFAVMHIFAFPIRPYSIKHSYSDPINEPGSGYSGGETLKYKGGPLGLYAILDALNPWDIVKASARGFRWLFVGVKKREQDISYQKANKLGGTATYAGPTYSGTGEAATELRASDDGGRALGTADALAPYTGEDDRAGLLRHSGRMAGHGTESSPYRTYTTGDSQVDLSAPPHREQGQDIANNTAPVPDLYAAQSQDFGPGRPSHWDEEDTGYHPGIGPTGVHPALRDRQQEPQWDHWAGAGVKEDGAESVRPPTYRTKDPHG